MRPWACDSLAGNADCSNFERSLTPKFAAFEEAYNFNIAGLLNNLQGDS